MASAGYGLDWKKSKRKRCSVERRNWGGEEGRQKEKQKEEKEEKRGKMRKGIARR